MKIDLTRHFIDYFNRFGELGLPGFGRLHSQHHSAKFADARTLKAPQRSIGFDADDSINVSKLARFIAAREGVSTEQVEHVLDVFTQRKMSAIEADGQVDVYPFGKIKKAGDAFSFEETKHGSVNPYLGLKSIEVAPIDRSAESKAAAALVGQSEAFNAMSSVEREESNWWRWLVILALALGIVVFYKMCKNQQSQNTRTSSSHLELDSTSQADDDVFFSEKGTDSLSEAQPVTSKAKPKTTSPAKLHIDDISAEDVDRVLKSEKLVKASPDAVVECIIILGSYKKQRNAIRMMRDVEAAGYKLYVGVHNNLTRVGLSYNCAKADLVTYIQNIRKTMVREAWYLQPELHVDY